MTVAELIEVLEDADQGAEVRLAFQPSWPLQFHIGNIVEREDGSMYLTQGSEPEDSPYAPSDLDW